MLPDIHIVERNGIALVFGMEWFPLLGRHPERQARVLGRRQRATHHVLSSGVAASVGLLRGGPRRRGGQRYCSAAAVFASLHRGGTMAAVLPLPGGGYWLAAAHEGAVMTRGDQLYAEPEHADDILRLLREAHPGLMLRDDGPPSGLLEVLFDAARGEGELLRMGGPFGLPAPFVPGVSLAAAALLGFLLWRVFMSAATEASVPPGEAADAAWRSAVAASVQNHAVHGVAGLRAVLDAIHDVPAGLAGWLLADIECRPQGAHWRCRAGYRRTEDSDNEGFISAARHDWALSFDPLEGARAAWSVPMPALPLGAVALRTARQNEARLVSALQAILPAFSELRLEAPQPLLPQPPLDAQRRPMVRPGGIVSYQRRPLRLQAPLRSLGLLLPETAHMSWDRILLQVAPVDQPSLRGSSLRVSLSGVLYEIDDSYSVSAHSSGFDATAGGRDGRLRGGGGTVHGA